MNVDDMKLLIQVNETGSMTRAAKHLNVTPAAVSAAVGRIEESIGVRLFERTTRSVRATDEGLALIETCHELVARWQNTLEDVQGGAKPLSGTIRIAVPSDTAFQIVAPSVVDLSKAHPGLRVVLHSSDSVQSLHRDAIDMAIRYGPLPDSSLSARRPLTVRRCLSRLQATSKTTEPRKLPKILHTTGL